MGSVSIRSRSGSPLMLGPSDHARSGADSRNCLQSPASGHTLLHKRTHRTAAQTGKIGVRLTRPRDASRVPVFLWSDETCPLKPLFRLPAIVCGCSSTSGTTRSPCETPTRRSARIGRSSGRCLRAATAVVDAEMAGEYQGLNFYGSHDPAREADRRLHRWATTVVDTFPGVSVSIVPRQRKRSPPVCPTCHSAVAQCPACGADMRGTEEKGVDVRMATDMISLAWADNYDIAVLVSSDRDFVPVAEFLETRGIKVIHGAFPPRGAQLTARCWGSVNVARLREEFRFTRPMRST